MFKAYVFDLEGTLVDFQWQLDPGVKATRIKLEEMGFDKEKLLKIDSYNDLFNEPVKDALMGRFNLPAYEVRKEIGEVWDFFDLDALSRWNLKEGVKDTLRRLHLKAPIALFTTIGWKAAKKTLEKFEIERLFDIMVTRDDVTLIKPYGDGLRLILCCLKVSAEETLYIGDSRGDILAAKEVGMKSGFLVGGEHDLPAEIKPDYVLHSIPDILDIE